MNNQMKKSICIFSILLIVYSCVSLHVNTANADIPLRTRIGFGSWEQDGNVDNGPEVITWIVVDQNETENSICLLAEKCLYAMPFSSSSNVTWQNSDIRTWLNGFFIQNAFGTGDRRLILPHESSGSTQYVSVPSAQEMEKFIKIVNKSFLSAKGTVAADSQTPTGKIAGYWLTDDAESEEHVGNKRQVVLINASLSEDNANAIYGVRPIIWVSLSQGTTTPSPSPAPTPYARRISNVSSAIEIVPDYVEASSYITGQKSKVPYPPSNLIDNLDDTSWQFSAKGDALGHEFVMFYFNAPATINELWIKNGYWKITDGHDQYTRNSRPKKITVSYLYAGNTSFTDIKSYTLKDDKKRKDWQKVPLGEHENVIQICIRIDSMYKGTKYKNDVCISEIKFIQ